MPVLSIILNPQRLLEGIDPATVVQTQQMIRVSALEGGMASGKPSVSFLIELPDGTHVFAETSLALFLTAADAFKARYGDPRE